jgi:hypothetical protein
MATTQTNKQTVLNAYILSENLEKFPSGQLISILKQNLEAAEFVKAMNFISEFVLQTILKACNTETLKEINRLGELKDEQPLLQFLQNLIVLDDKVAIAGDNALVFACKTVARSNKINLDN